MDWLPKPGTVLVQRYRLEEQVGRGAHGVVFRAHDQKKGETCALKVFHPELLSSGRKEILKKLRLRKKLQSPKILSILDVIATKDTVALVEPFLEHLSLRDSARLGLAGTDALSPLETVRLLTALEEALETVHSQSGHGNVKPENIFVGEGRYVLAHAYHVPGIHTLKWSAGHERLQQHYFAPEQIIDPGVSTPSVDTFAVAMVVGEVLAGGRVKDGLPLSVQTSQEISGPIDELFIAATDRNPEARPELKTFVRQMSEALVSFTEEKEEFNQDITLVSGVPTITDEMAADLESGLSHDEVLKRARERRQESFDNEDTSPGQENVDGGQVILGTTQPLPPLSEFGLFHEVGAAKILGGADLPSNARVLLRSSIVECAKDWSGTFEIAAESTGHGPPGLAANIGRRDTEDFELLEIDDAKADDETSLMKAAPAAEVSFADVDRDIVQRAVAVEKVLSAIDADSMTTVEDGEDDRFLSIDVLDSIPEAIHELENPTIEISLLEEDGDFEFEELEGDEVPLTDELEAQVVAEADEVLAGFDDDDEEVEFVTFEEMEPEDDLGSGSHDFEAIDIDEIDDDVAEEIARTVKVEVLGEASDVFKEEGGSSIPAQLAGISRRYKRGTSPQVPVARLGKRLKKRKSSRTVYLWGLLGIFVTFSITIVALVLANRSTVPDGQGLFLTQRGPGGAPTVVPETPAPATLVVSDEGNPEDSAQLVSTDVAVAASDPGQQGAQAVTMADVVPPVDPDIGLRVEADELGVHIQLPDMRIAAAEDPGQQKEEPSADAQISAVTDVAPREQPAAPVEVEPEEPAASPVATLSGCLEGFLPVEGAFCMQSHEFPGVGQKPRTRVTYAQAESICSEQGARMCSGDEFKQACGNKYPYGKRFRRKRCNVAGEFFEGGRIFKSGTKQKCVSPSGIFDLSGNVAEWIEGGRTVGGSVKQEGRNVSCTRSKKRTAKYKSSMVGFRCCMDLAKP